jgi:hypothetical protein
MFRLAGMAAVLLVALCLAPGRANDPGPPFGGQGTRRSFSLEGQLYERLRLSGAASVAGYDLRAKRVTGGQMFDVAITRRNAAGEVDFWGQAAAMELRSDRGGKRLLMRLTNGEARSNDGSCLTFLDRTWEVPLP